LLFYALCYATLAIADDAAADAMLLIDAALRAMQRGCCRAPR